MFSNWFIRLFFQSLHYTVTWCLDGGTSNEAIHSQTMDVAFYLYSFVVIISFVSIYVKQNFEFDKIKAVLSTFSKVVEALKKYSTKNINLRKYFLFLFLKTIVFDSFNYLVMYNNLKKTSVKLRSYPYLALPLYGPILIVRFNANLFFCGILFNDIVLKLLNKNLLKLMDAKKNVPKVNMYCQLSDELDGVSDLYFKLNKTMKTFNSIFNLQILLWVVSQMAVLILRSFHQYHQFMGIVSLHGETYLSSVVDTLLLTGATILILFEIFITSYACESVAAEVNKNDF